MIKFHWLLFALMTSLAMTAQTQHGRVKTKGRIVNGQYVEGHGLPGATVFIQGGRNVAVQNQSGTFSFPVSTQTFRVDSVKKKDYLLVDVDVTRKSYKHSSNLLVLVMEKPEQQLADQLAQEKKQRRELQKRIQQREDEIESLNVSLEEKNRLLLELNKDREDNEKIVKDLSKYYAMLDYDELDDFQRQVNYLLENFELEKADSMLRSRGSMDSRIREVREEQAAEAKEEKDLEDRQEKLAVSRVGTKKKLEDIAADCYSFYQRFWQEHQNDSATYYLEIRASLDTANVEWQDLAAMALEFSGYYKNALPYRLRIINLCKKEFGENSVLTAKAYQNLAQTYSLSSDDMKALDVLLISLSILKSIPDNCNLEIAKTYNSIGRVLYSLRWTSRAILSFNQAIDVWRSINNIEGLADSYRNLGDAYLDSNEYDKALKYYHKADSIYNLSDTISGKYKGDLLKQIGEVYYAKENYNLALYYLKSSLDCKIKSDVDELLLSYDMTTIGNVCLENKDYKGALFYFQKAKDIRKKNFGDSHFSVAWSYRDIGDLYLEKKEYEKAVEYHNRAHQIISNSYDEYSDEMARSYMRLGTIYAKMDNYYEALVDFKKGLSIRLAIFGEYNQDVALSYEAVGGACLMLELFDESVHYFKKALSIFKSINGGNHPWSSYAENAIIRTEYERSIKEKNVSAFQKTHCLYLVFNGKTEQDQANGLSGEYVLLELEDWTCQSHTSLFKAIKELRGKPKNVVLMKNGNIKCYHFDDKIGGEVLIKEIGTDIIDKYINIYNQWKIAR